MKPIVPGDVVGHGKRGKYDYYIVLRTEKGKLVCADCDDEYEEELIRLDPEKVDHYPSVTTDRDTLRKLLRYETSFSDLFGDLYPYCRLRCEEPVVMTGEDLLAAMYKCKERGFAAAKKEWVEPVRALFGTVFNLEEDLPLESVDGYRFLPQKGQLLLGDFTALIWRGWNDTDGAEIDKLIKRTENTLKMLSLSVPQRDYDDGVKERYIKAFDNDDMLKAATDAEVALWVKYVEELCEKGNTTALYAKAYSLYGGNRAYACDWCGSRDLLLKLMEVDESPFLANTLGYLFYYGRCADGKPDYEKAFYYYNIGAAGGVYESRYKLSDMYRHGYWVKKNARIAAGLARELYYENLRFIQEGRTDGKFADIALRMGHLRLDGGDADDAYWYYLQAEFAIKQRMRDCDRYGDSAVADGIAKAIEEVLPQTSYRKPRHTVYGWSALPLISSALDLNRRVEAKIKRLKNGQYSLCFRILPLKGEFYPSRFFVTIPEAHFCGYMDRITVKTAKIERFAIGGKLFDGDEAVIVFDEATDSDYYFYGERVMHLCADFALKIPSPSAGKTYRFASVMFSEGGKRYDYLCNLPDIKVGDEVVVPSPDGDVQTRVVRVFEKNETETSLPISKYKSVLNKA